MQDDFKILALKIECAQITARRNMPEVTGVGIRSTDLTFLPIKDRLTTIPTREMYTCKFCIAATFVVTDHVVVTDVVIDDVIVVADAIVIIVAFVVVVVVIVAPWIKHLNMEQSSCCID